MDFNEGFFVELATSPPVTALCVDAAEKIAGVARDTAPEDTADYKNGIVVVVKRQNLRNVAVVKATDKKSMLIESKTGNLVRALRKVGRSG